ncbi:5-formyltetrahydrofolate cyclo-ligase-like protein [Basidiobolus meristosporus CBS 931.73]|uniref:5-formyltetrahydrofolate cyclo-ligase n=1 Tax=Basidiobolus meristosporus CBS 931.73 TaxID=1314790 RepID=A0A1Y1YFL3_9FUNG|nr:5-formyltetrahydrofolate cyclo-ligase-like protein [Basidiobolus meristosporus CBS 931.73]|eukprot:ORX96830.1 5-formyltetrahydrofolate cyclo-ligase-like protein [Basidiobolus meristosporus CBS 931.73]
MQSIKVLKNAIRKDMRTKMRSLPKDSLLEQTRSVQKKVLGLEELHKSSRVGIYLSLPTEISTTELLRELFKQNKACYVPRWGNNHMDMVRLTSWSDYEGLPVNSFGIPEPAHEEKRINAFEEGGLDVLIMPGLAFDKFGNRLGRGKGYYDRYLNNYQSLGKSFNRKAAFQKPFLVGLALNEQISGAPIPTDEFDNQVDLVITSKRNIHKQHGA